MTLLSSLLPFIPSPQELHDSGTGKKYKNHILGGTRDAIYLFAPACGGRLIEY